MDTPTSTRQPAAERAGGDDPVVQGAIERLRKGEAAIPHHLAVIPDGNRRWAEERGETVMDGHRKGFEVAKKLSRFCRQIGIHTITVWAFSTENWKRSADQVAALMALYEEWLSDLLPEAIEEEVRVVHLGRLEGVPAGAEPTAAAAGFPDGLPASLKVAIEQIEAKTEAFTRNVINLAINYGGADEMQRAIEKMSRASGADPAAFTTRAGLADTGGPADTGGIARLDVSDFLDTAGQPYPNPDIVWRTSGEMRSSGFLPLQSAYAEMVFTPKYFPSLTEEDVVETVLEYSARIRRFGG
ncbi:MAG: di-trans,poly-cis-decaprenylcistransferase [Actinobacteria bacterium]|nr:di-trans,poly-cis-decaprenylcistransferase [Actinomycetota bacterium]